MNADIWNPANASSRMCLYDSHCCKTRGKRTARKSLQREIYLREGCVSPALRKEGRNGCHSSQQSGKSVRKDGVAKAERTSKNKISVNVSLENKT